MPAMGEKRCFDRVAAISGLAPSADVRTGFHQYTTTLKHLQQPALFHQPRPPRRPEQVAKANGVTSGSGFEVDCEIKLWVAAYFGEDAANYATLPEPWADGHENSNRATARLSPNEIDAIEDCLYEHNSHVTERHNGQGLGFVIRDELGRLIGVAAGYTWAGTSELKQMCVDKSYRGRGYARALLNAFVTEASSRGVRRIWVASYDFQAPGLYEKAGFKRVAEFKEWPEGHTNVVLCKTLLDQKTDRPNVR